MSFVKRYYPAQQDDLEYDDNDIQEMLRELYDEMTCEGRFPPFSEPSDEEIEARLAA